MKKALTTMALSFLFASVITSFPSDLRAESQPQETEIKIYSAEFGGISYTIAAGFAKLVTKKHPWLRVTNLETAGSIYNVKVGADDPKDRAISIRQETSPVFWTGTKGQDPFDRKYGLKSLMTYMASSYVVVTDDPAIRKPQDLKGKRVSVGSPASSFLVEAQFMLKDCWGIWNDIKHEWLGFKASRDAFMDRLVDAVVTPAIMVSPTKFVIHPLMGEVIRLRKLYFIGLTPEELKRGKAESGWPVSSIVIPAGAFAKGMPEKDMLSWTLTLSHCAYPELDEKVAYEYVKMAHENVKAFAGFHAAAKIMQLPGVMSWTPAVSLDEVHPGALKYFKEQGMKVYFGGDTPF